MPSKLEYEITKLRGEVSNTKKIYTNTIADLEDKLIALETKYNSLESENKIHNVKIKKANEKANTAYRKATESHSSEKHKNRERIIERFVPFHNEGSTYMWGSMLDADVDESVYYRFKLPTDYNKSISLTFLTMPITNGDVVFDYIIYYGCIGESITANSNSSIGNVITMVSFEINEHVINNLITGIKSNDIVTIRIKRDADNVNDVLLGDIGIIGVFLKYEADM